MRTKEEHYPYGEVISILWGGVRVWYANQPFNYAPFQNIYNHIDDDTINVRLPNNWHNRFKIGPITEDSDTSFPFDDYDSHFTNLHNTHGSGARVEIYGYWPTITDDDPNGLFLLLWWGLLGTPDEDEDETRFNVKAKAGIRSPKLNFPRGTVQRGCRKPFGGQTNPATGERLIPTQALIDEHGCPWNRHIGGSVGVSGFTTCPRVTLNDCVTRLGSITLARQYFGGYPEIDAYQTVGYGYRDRAGLQAGNPTIIRQAIPVPYGVCLVSDLKPLIYHDQAQGAPGGYIRVVWLIGEGELGINPALPAENGTAYIKVDNIYVVPAHTEPQPGVLQATYRIPGATIGGQVTYIQSVGYSRVAYMITDLLQRDFPNWNVFNTRASVLVDAGIKIRRYTDDTLYVMESTTNRGWVLFDALTNKVYGLGLDRGLFVMDDWISLAEWCGNDTYVPPPDDGGSNEQGTLSIEAYFDEPGDIDTNPYPEGTTPPGGTVKRRRSSFNHCFQESKVQDAIHGICAGGNIGDPFFWGGKIRVVPLGRQNLASDVPLIFTRESQIYGFKNIQDGSLKHSKKDDDEVPNSVKYTIKLRDPSNTDLFIDQNLVFDDKVAQLKAGLAGGDATFRVTEKSVTGLGITNLHEGLRMGAITLDLGELEAGGLVNNVTVRFKTFFPTPDAIQLHPWKVIEIKDAKIQAKYKQINGNPFKYFRVLELERQEDLSLDVKVQGYSEYYYQQIEGGVYARNLPSPRGVTKPRLPIQLFARPERPVNTRDGSRVIVRKR